jgi:ribonuclease T2
MRIMRLFAVTLLACWILPHTAAGQSRRNNRPAREFSYYVLSLSYAPNFCDQPGGNKDPRECGLQRRIGFVVHGLWPQGESSRGPENCGRARPVAQETVRAMLRYMPSESLIQHEWAAHGTCSGLNANGYFSAVRKARDATVIPADLVEPARRAQFPLEELEAKFAAANPAYPRNAFRASCYRDGELQEIRVCFGKDLSPRPCSLSAGRCSLANVTILPVR